MHISAKGFAGSEREFAGGTPEKTIVLKAEHRVTGRVIDAVTGQPIPAFTAILVFRKDWLHAGRGNAESGKDGSGPSVPLDLQAEQEAELDLGGAGALVTGKVTLTGKVPADLNCTYSINYLVRRAPGISPPPEIAHLGFDARTGWRDSWRNTTEGQAYFRTLQSWFVKLAPDGAFQISGVPPGEYDLSIAVFAKPDG